MLNIQIRNKDDYKMYTDIENLFRKSTIRRTSNISKFIQDIDSGIYIDERNFKDRFGNIARIDWLSTGCKAAILVELNDNNELIDTIECGTNALSAIISVCRKGNILIQKPISKYVSYTGLDEIDVAIDGYRFTSLKRLNLYLFEEMRLTPNMSIKGIQKIDGNMEELEDSSVKKKRGRKLKNR